MLLFTACKIRRKKKGYYSNSNRNEKIIGSWKESIIKKRKRNCTTQIVPFQTMSVFFKFPKMTAQFRLKNSRYFLEF